MRDKLTSIFSNTVAQLAAKFVSSGLTLVTTIIIIRLVGASLYGDLTKVLVLIAIGFTAIDFGLNAEAVRRMGRGSDEKLTLADVLSARLLLSVLAAIATTILVFRLPGGYTPAIKSVFWVGAVAIIFQGIFTSTNAWFQYRERYWLSAWATIAGAVISTGATYWFTTHAPTLMKLVAADSVGYIVAAIVAWYFARRVASFSVSPRRVMHILGRSAVLGCILIASVIAAKIDTVILGVFRSSAEVGDYGFAYRIFEVILVLPTFVMNAAYPLLVKLEKGRAAQLLKTTIAWLGGLGVAAAIVVWFLAPAIALIRPGLTLAITCLRLLTLSLPIFYVTAPLMWRLISRGRDAPVLATYIAAALVNAALNLATAPHYGPVAAAVNTGVTELFIFIVLFSLSQKDHSL